MLEARDLNTRIYNIFFGGGGGGGGGSDVAYKFSWRFDHALAPITEKFVDGNFSHNNRLTTKISNPTKIKPAIRSNVSSVRKFIDLSQHVVYRT